MYKIVKPVLFCAFLSCYTCTLAQTASSYFVSTSGEDTVETDSLGNAVYADESNMTAEEKFLNANFPTLSLCDWQEGMNFMVIPGEKDQYLRTFTDSLSGSEIGTGTLQNKIITYKGHETTPRGYEHINFYCNELKKAYYVELRNFTFADYCHKVENGGIRALAYLGDVDKARELLIGKEIYTRGTNFYQDDKNVAGGKREVSIKEDSHAIIEMIGVGTRDFPVKIVFKTDDGKLYFQEVAMSRINCSLVADDFYRENARHLFSNSFAFDSQTGKNSATMSAKLLGKKINTRQNVKMQNKDGATQTMKRNTVFLVKEIKQESAGSDYYKMTLGNEGNDYTIRVTFKNKDVSGNVDGKQESYFYELFSIGTEFNANNSTIVHSTNVTSSGGFAGMVSGIVSKGMTMNQVKLTKGEPDQKWKNKNGTTSWKYFDSTYTFNKAGRLTSISETY